MITVLLQPVQSSVSVATDEFDPTESTMSIGVFGMRRTKRDGRNPSTGARTSRRYGLSMFFRTGYASLVGTDDQPLY